MENKVGSSRHFRDPIVVITQNLSCDSRKVWFGVSCSDSIGMSGAK